jgi:hypothetical protein
MLPSRIVHFVGVVVVKVVFPPFGRAKSCWSGSPTTMSSGAPKNIELYRSVLAAFVFDLKVTVAPALLPSNAVMLKVYVVKDLRLVKVKVVAVLGKAFVLFVEPATAVSLMLLIFVLENASQEIFAVVEVVIALTIVALGTDVSALAEALPIKSAVMTARAATRIFKVCLTSDE